MNAPIVRLYVLVAALFGLLVLSTSWWTVFEAEGLRDNELNRRTLLEEARIERGRIRSADGTVLARSVPGPGETWQRTYPSGELFGHAIGYSYTNLGRSGLEQSRNGLLTGQETEIDSLVDQLAGKRREGDDVTTNLDAAGQRIALQALGGQRGAVVAMEPRTGRVRVMASVPQYDPNRVQRSFRRLARQDGSPLLNRATQGGYPPGSTFKVVTAAAALDSGRYTPDSTVSGKNGKAISGVPLQNFGGQDYGSIPLTEALTNSVNTVWGEVGVKLGRGRMGEYMERFGFYRKPPLDYPARQRAASGEFGKRGRLLDRESRQIDVGRMAIGQDKLAVTPLQMATVAATVANGGLRMKPRLTRRAVDPDGRTSESIDAEEAERVMRRSTASQLTGMMANVVKEGTGTAAALEGIEVAGKTGTAEIDPARDINQVWFIGFAPVRNPRIAVAVTIERSDGEGGTVAAPIAKRIMEALLR